MSTINSSEVIVRHQGAQVESFIYPSRADSIVSLAQVKVVGGSLRNTANSVLLGATSNFQVSTTDLLHGLALYATLTVPASNVISTSGWLFSLIQRIEVVYPNSSSPTLNISGTALAEFMLLTCKDENERFRLIENAGTPTAAGAVASACIPMWYLLGQANGTAGGSYPLDMSTLTGTAVQINITWYPSTYIICRTGAAPSTALVQFDSLYMIGSTTILEDKSLGVRPQLMANPNAAYVLHGKGLYPQQYPMTFASGAQQTINLFSAPDAGLNAIILSIRPSVEFSANGNGTSNNFGSCGVTQLQLSHGSEILFQANSRREYLQHLREVFAGDELLYRYAYDSDNSSAAASQDLVETGIIVIPFDFHARQVMSQKITENVKSYSNVPLALSFTPSGRFQYDASASPFYPTAMNPRGGAGSQAYTVEVIYVTNAMLDIDRAGTRIVY